MKLSLLFLFLVVSCAHYEDVRPGVDGVHKVIVRAEEKDQGSQNAIEQANYYCEKVEHDKHAAFIDEKIEYTGSMDEKTRDTLRKASKAAEMVGGTSASVNSNNEDWSHDSEQTNNMGKNTTMHKRKHVGAQVNPPNPIGTAGAVGTIMTSGKDYLIQMTFKCQ